MVAAQPTVEFPTEEYSAVTAADGHQLQINGDETVPMIAWRPRNSEEASWTSGADHVQPGTSSPSVDEQSHQEQRRASDSVDDEHALQSQNSDQRTGASLTSENGLPVTRASGNPEVETAYVVFE
jgi:hypothetical protein